MEWTKKQQEFLNVAKQYNDTTGFIFLTGKAGTGKTTCIKEFISLIKEPVIKLATTGIAATLFGGQTIHSFFAIPPLNILTKDNCIFVKGDTRYLWDAAKVIIIDEASMLRPDMLDFIDWQLLKNNCDSLSTKLIVFIGDFKQLPPITDQVSFKYLTNVYGEIDFRRAKIIKHLDTIVLDEIKRQSNPFFVNALNVIREGKQTKYFDRFKHKQQQGVILCPFKWQVDKYNNEFLNQLPNDVVIFTAQITGNVKQNDVTIPFNVAVKHGAKIMYLYNTENLINGDIGTFEIENDKYYFNSIKGRFQIQPVTIEKKKYVYNEDGFIELITVGSITQLPIQLAFAITIHKSQGQTFEEITIDNSCPMFEQSQMYVALSRVTSPKGLSII